MLISANWSRENNESLYFLLIHNTSRWIRRRRPHRYCAHTVWLSVAKKQAFFTCRVLHWLKPISYLSVTFFSLLIKRRLASLFVPFERVARRRIFHALILSLRLSHVLYRRGLERAVIENISFWSRPIDLLNLLWEPVDRHRNVFVEYHWVYT
jgi:hypothetical protein